jgi:hypothetical protein
LVGSVTSENTWVKRFCGESSKHTNMTSQHYTELIHPVNGGSQAANSMARKSPGRKLGLLCSGVALALLVISTVNVSKRSSPASLVNTEGQETATQHPSLAAKEKTSFGDIIGDLKKQASAIREAALVSKTGKQDAVLVTHLSDKVRFSPDHRTCAILVREPLHVAMECWVRVRDCLRSSSFLKVADSHGKRGNCFCRTCSTSPRRSSRMIHMKRMMMRRRKPWRRRRIPRT